MSFSATLVCFVYLISASVIETSRSPRKKDSPASNRTNAERVTGVTSVQRRSVDEHILTQFANHIGKKMAGQVEEDPELWRDVNIYPLANPIKLSNVMEYMRKIPKMVVFDLNYTLWPFEIGIHRQPPFVKNRSGKVKDLSNKTLEYYPEVPKVLEFLQKNNISVSVASRTVFADDAEQLLDFYGWNKYFQNKQIYPGCKNTHLNEISKATKVSTKEMLFFDDRPENIEALEGLGVISMLTVKGVDLNLLVEALKRYDLLKDWGPYEPETP